ncbi:PucR family transcriptional regulator, partial [Pseudonocardia asaccharolytica]|uniref:PucR family transcriptional regulator n=1 Tax=Pseudonocardia asaccharolytica TaxID=54010 RepID=UPI0011BFADE6
PRHQLDLDLVRREERERLTFLHNALTGTLRPAELLEGGAAYGLRPDREYWVLRARAMTRSRGAAELISPLERATATPHHPPLLGLIGEDVAGITARPPDHGPDGALVAVEGPVPATGLHAAFVEATRQLEIAARFDLRGVVDAARLSLRAAVADQARLGEMLFRRYVAGVLADTAIAATILDSVRAYLDHRRSIPTTARALNVHVNTLRYRLQRFATITGADLQDTVTAMEVWWALQYARIRRRPEP